MTTTASKSTGRAAHTRRTAKAAQRTPLPPKGATSNPASSKADIAAAAKPTRKRAPSKAATAAALAKLEKTVAPSNDTSAKAAPRPVRGTKAQPEARMPEAAPKAVNDLLPGAAPAKAAPRRRRPVPASATAPTPSETTKARKATTPAPVPDKAASVGQAATADTFAGSKPKALAADVLAAGWVLGGTSDGKRDVLTAMRGIEALEMAWDNNVYDRKGTYTVGGKPSFCANMATFRRFLERDPSQVKAPVAGGKASGDTATPSASKKVQALMGAEDSPLQRATIMEAVQGHAIKWTNPHSSVPEESYVPRTGDPLPGGKGRFYTNRHLSITTNPEGRRMLNWCGPDGFHSAYLDSILVAA